MNSLKSISILSIITVMVIFSNSVVAGENLEEKTQQEVKALEMATFQNYVEKQQLQQIELPQQKGFAVIDAEGNLIYQGEGKDPQGIKLILAASYVNEANGVKYFLKEK